MTAYKWHADPLIDAAMTAALARFPYYAAGLSRLDIRPDNRVPTMATSAAWVTHYNRDTVKGWTTDETAAVLVHELEHLLRRHHERCGDRDPKGFNVAGDAEINQRLPGLPSGAVYPSTLGMPDGRTAETYYSAAGLGDDKSDPDGEPEPGDGDPGDGSGSGSGSAGTGPTNQCGSAAGGPAQEHESDDYNASVPNDQYADAARAEVAKGVIAGTDASDDLREWAMSELGIDRSRWYAALAASVGRSASSFGAPTRWQWPGRRDMADMGGAMLPHWTGNRPEAAIVIDTSGSISAFDIDMARAAATFVARVADVRYYGCNTQVRDYGKTLPDTIRGGGGTDLTVGIERAIADGAKAVVVITDGYTPWPHEAPRVPVIIGLNPSASGIGMPDWATVLPITGQGAAE